MNDLRVYRPSILGGVLEYEELLSAENNLFAELELETLRAENNQFIKTANTRTIVRWEGVLGIISNPDVESLEFRRDRVINRLSLSPPFTTHFLEQRLDEIIGVGRWNMYLEGYTLIVESSVVDQSWSHEVLVTMSRLKPANIVFINKPFIVNKIKAAEEIKHTQVIYNYRVGTSWVLGAKPFTTLEDMGVIKMGSTASVQNTMFEEIASCMVTSITKARINELEVIETFLVKESTNNTAIIEYAVPWDSALSEITLIELLDANDNVLAKSVVYIPFLDTIVLKHTFKVEEGI